MLPYGFIFLFVVFQKIQIVSIVRLLNTSLVSADVQIYIQLNIWVTRC